MEQEVNYEQEKIKIRFENGTYNAVRYKWQKTKHRSCVRVSSSAAQLSSSFGKVMYTYSKYSISFCLHYVGCYRLQEIACIHLIAHTILFNINEICSMHWSYQPTITLLTPDFLEFLFWKTNYVRSEKELRSTSRKKIQKN